MCQIAAMYTTYQFGYQSETLQLEGIEGALWLLPKICKVQPAHKKGLLELQARDKLNSMTLECEAMLRTQMEICKRLVNVQGCSETTTDRVRPTLETCHFVYQNQG